MTLLKKKTSSEGSENWEHPAPDDAHAKTPDPVPPASPQQELPPQSSWLREIGWYERARENAANRVAAGKAAASKVDHSYRPAPMHRREVLADNEPRNARNAHGPVQQQNRKRTRQLGSIASFAIGAVATLVGIICFIVAYDITSGGGIRKTLISKFSSAHSSSDKTISLAETKPKDLEQKTPQETIKLVEKKPLVLEQQTPPASGPVQTANKETIPLAVTKPVVLPQQSLPAADPVQTATIEAPLKAVAPVAKIVDVVPAKPAKITPVSAPVPAKAAPVPLPVAVAPPPEVKPEVKVSAAPEPPAPVVPKPTAPTVVALASPPGLQKLSPVERDVFQDCDNCPVMVVVQSGRFQMGAVEDSGASPPYELPVHQVSITKPFAIGRFEITAKDWDQCVAGKGCQPLSLGEGWNSPQQPAIQVSWNDIEQQYLPWLSKVTGKTYRLPTEAEWEYAAKGGSAAGSSEAQDFGGVATTIAVGSRKPNSLGLYDMHGNVWEWVEDCWNDNYTLTPADGSAAATGDCNLRIARGGSWASSDPNLLSTKRGWNKPTTKNNTLGFRVVRSL